MTIDFREIDGETELTLTQAALADEGAAAGAARSVASTVLRRGDRPWPTTSSSMALPAAARQLAILDQAPAPHIGAWFQRMASRPSFKDPPPA